MRIWIATVSEQVPSDSPTERLLRGGIWARELARMGHQVVWWTDNVDHMRKRLRARENVSVHLAPNLELRMVAGPGYQRSVSPARLLHYRRTSLELAKWMRASTPPDVCLVALPALEWVEAVLDVGEALGFPVVVDCRDMWPDVFVTVAPGYLRWPARLALQPLFRKKRRVLRKAYAISGITSQYLEWGLAGAGRKHNGRDFVTHHAYSPPAYGSDDLAEAGRFWDDMGLAENRNLLTICYFGVLATSSNFQPVISGLGLLGPLAPQVRLVVCGDGYKLSEIRRSASGMDNVYFAGHVSGVHIKTMMDRSDVALAPFASIPNFLSNIPGKISEYLSNGLPILCGITGATGEYVQSNQCGWVYRDAADFVSCVTRLLNEPHVHHAAHLRAMEAFQRDFRADNVVRGAERALQLIVDRWSGPMSP